MNLQARIDVYRERGFQELEAEILVLIEESAAALFTAFPDQFVLFGGATLVLFYESPRLSRDLDLLASPTQIPRPEKSRMLFVPVSNQLQRRSAWANSYSGKISRAAALSSSGSSPITEP